MEQPASVYTKISANLPNTTIDALKKMADRSHTTMTEALKNAIELAAYLSTRADAGENVLVGHGETYRQILVPPLIRSSAAVSA